MKNWLRELLKLLIPVISAPLREVIIASVDDWEKKAAQTANPWDDIFVGLLKWLLQIP